MRIGIVGHEAAKFTPETEAQARQVIRDIIIHAHELTPNVVDLTVVSGGCHLGGVDIWAEEEADKLIVAKQIFKPKRLTWSGPGGFQDRNIKIAENSVTVHVVVVRELPPTYTGMTFKVCYHCAKRKGDVPPHVKSGACWTANYALRLGNSAQWHVIG